MTDIPRPVHAYIPGQTARHAEGLFDPLKVGVHPDMTEAEMQASVPWRAGNAYRADGYYWECHEVLEALWLVTPDGAVRNYVQAVIQLANAQLKARMGRPNAVRRLCGIVCQLLERCEGREVILGQSLDALHTEAVALAQAQKDVQKNA